MKLPKYVQAWVDRRDDRAYYYLRRRGFPRVRLPGLPWSPRFMAAYEAAMSGPRTAIGTGRIKPGSVAAVVAEYFDSQQFFASKKPGTRRMRRASLSASARPMAIGRSRCCRRNGSRRCLTRSRRMPPALGS